MLFIISCHIFQFYNNELAWWFNVGVQIFLIVSGYLYAKKEVKSKKEFYSKQFQKIIIPYYIYISTIIIIYFLIKNNFISIEIIFKSLLFIDEIKGLEHLWFIRYILLCYLLIPVYQNIIVGKNSIFKIIILLFVNELIGLITNNFFNGTWLNCFVVGMLLNIYYDYLKNEVINNLIMCVIIAFNIIEILLKYVMNINFTWIFQIIFNKYCNICHLMLGVVLFLLLKDFYKKFFSKRKHNKLLDLSDKYSFYIYITHHIFILGNYSIYKYIDNLLISTIVVIVITIISSIILKTITELFFKLIKNKSKMKVVTS